MPSPNAPSSPTPVTGDPKTFFAEDFLERLGQARRGLRPAARTLVNAGVDPYLVGVAAIYEAHLLMSESFGADESRRFLRVVAEATAD